MALHWHYGMSKMLRWALFCSHFKILHHLCTVFFLFSVHTYTIAVVNMTSMSRANQLIFLYVVFVRYVCLHWHSRWVCVAARASVTSCSRRSLDIVGGHWPSSHGCGLCSDSTVRVSHIVSTCTWKFCKGITRFSVVCYSEVLTDLFSFDM